METIIFSIFWKKTITRHAKEFNPHLNQNPENFRSGEAGYEDFDQHWGLGPDQVSEFGQDSTQGSGLLYHDPTADNTHSLFSDNANDATETLDDKLFLKTDSHEVFVGVDTDSQSSTSNHKVPEFVYNQNSNTTESFFGENSQDSATPQQLDFSNVSFSFDSSVGFHTTYDGVSDFVSSLCDPGDKAGLNSTLQVVPETNENLPDVCIVKTGE